MKLQYSAKKGQKKVKPIIQRPEESPTFGGIAIPLS